MKLKLLHVASGKANAHVWSEPFRRALAELGTLQIVEDADSLAEDEIVALLRRADVVLGSWGSARVPEALADSPGKVRYLCCVTGGVRHFVSLRHIDAGIPVTNWGDTPAHEVAEGAVCLLLAALKDLHAQIMSVRNGGGGAVDNVSYGGSLRGLNVGIYGFGVIGRRFAQMLQPFGCVIRVFDPYVAEMPSNVIRVETLEELFSQSEAVAIHAGLTEQTRGSVTRELLALLPRHGLIVNTARGDIIDQPALFDELRSGRLRAALDVLAEPESLPPDHEARQWENLILTCHYITRGWPTDGLPPTRLLTMHEVCIDNLKRFRNNQPLRFLMDRRRFELST